MKTKINSLSLLISLLMISFASLFSQSNQYLHFDLVDDHVIMIDGSQYIANSDGITMSGWFFTDDLVYGQGMMGIRGTGAGFYLIQLSNGVLECRYINDDGFYEVVGPAGTIVPQVWQHIAWVYDGSSVILYVDGIQIGSSSAAGQITKTDVDFVIGKSILAGFNFIFGGRVDEVSLWNKGLSQSEIQDLMNNELEGNEANLQIYYKFNQGVPGGDNTSIEKLIDEVGSGERDADLLNFALNGETSNFNGTLNLGFQAITFPQIPNKLISSPDFDLEAAASSGLQVFYMIESGPASINGNTITLSGDAGEVIVKASQPGDDTYDPAEDIFNSFMVLDPATHVPVIDARNPLEGDVYVGELGPIQLAVISYIDYPELFSVDDVYFQIDGQTIDPLNLGNTHYNGWWTPSSYGDFTLEVFSKNNYGAIAIESYNISISENAINLDIVAFENIWLNPEFASIEVETELPCFTGAYSEIIGTLELTCPPGGCGEWDRVANIEIQGHDGKWYEIIHYVTPYGVSCDHIINLTDYSSLLQGKVNFRVNCATLDNGYYWNLNLNYVPGVPDYNYSSVTKIWKDIYPFGDYANPQPVDAVNFNFPANTEASTLKLVASGHGWGDLNTGNAAEFHEDIHHISVNGEEVFEQHNWAICNPNPDNCQPQSGTWYHNRAGFCPGAISPWFDYNMEDYINTGIIELDYIFNPDYLDLCHPNHPDCVTGVTCSDCNSGFNPQLHTACNLIIWGNTPIDNALFVGEAEYWKGDLSISPNPTNGQLYINVTNEYPEHTQISLISMNGNLIEQFDWNGSNIMLDLSAYPKGVYFLKIEAQKNSEIRKVVLQ